jgi:hypothetical protein
MGPYPVSLTNQQVKQWGKSQESIDDRLLGLLGPYHQHTISTFNTFSWGSTHRSLTDTGGGYNLEGVNFLHTTLWPSQLDVSPFHLSAPRSYVIKQLITIWLKGDHALNLVSESIHSTSTVTYNLSIAELTMFCQDRVNNGDPEGSS